MAAKSRLKTLNPIVRLTRLTRVDLDGLELNASKNDSDQSDAENWPLKPGGSKNSKSSNRSEETSIHVSSSESDDETRDDGRESSGSDYEGSEKEIVDLADEMENSDDESEETSKSGSSSEDSPKRTRGRRVPKRNYAVDEDWISSDSESSSNSSGDSDDWFSGRFKPCKPAREKAKPKKKTKKEEEEQEVKEGTIGYMRLQSLKAKEEFFRMLDIEGDLAALQAPKRQKKNVEKEKTEIRRTERERKRVKKFQMPKPEGKPSRKRREDYEPREGLRERNTRAKYVFSDSDSD